MAGSALHIYADDILLYRTINSEHDYVLLQSDINTITSWSSANFLTLNKSKCKFMILSRRRSPTSPVTPLAIDDHPLEHVSNYKYLGVHLSSDLSWSTHIQSITAKARKVLGLLYRKFYNFSPPDVLVHLYLSLVRPLLEYAAVVWSPHLKKNILELENVQKFGLRMATKLWQYPYEYVLQRTQITTLENRRNIARLCELFKIIHKISCTECTVNLKPIHSHRTSHHLTLCRPFCHTNLHYYSFLPFAVFLWNNLDSSVVSSSSLQFFKSSISSMCS